MQQLAAGVMNISRQTQANILKKARYCVDCLSQGKEESPRHSCYCSPARAGEECRDRHGLRIGRITGLSEGGAQWPHPIGWRDPDTADG